MVDLNIATSGSSSTVSGSSAPVYSTMADDPEFRELLEMFAAEMVERRSDLTASFQAGDIEALRMKAHQLKGAGGGYGFDGLTTVAADLEQACKDGNLPRIAATLEQTLHYLSRIAI